MPERLSGGYTDPAPTLPEEKESFSDASYIPRDEAPKAPRVYAYSSEEKESRDKTADSTPRLTPRGLAALCVCCVVLGLGVGIVYTRHRAIDISEPLIPTETETEVRPASPVPPAAPRPESSVPELSASEIYSASAEQVVSITASAGDEEPTDLCTGFFVSGDGYILTAGRPVQDALRQEQTLHVRLSGESCAVQVVGCEQETGDVAVLKLDISGRHSVSPGDSRQLTAGDTVYIVSGTGAGRFLTRGTLAAPEGEITADGVELLSVTAEAADLPAGSAVYNTRGQVVGFLSDSYVLPVSAAAAVPIGDALSVVNRLTEAAPVQGQPRLGIIVQTVSEAAAEYYNQYGENHLIAGARVCAMADLGSAAFAGVQVGDILTALDNYVITSEADLARAEREYRIGESAVLTLRRGEQTVTLSVVFSAAGYPAAESDRDEYFRSFPADAVR